LYNLAFEVNCCRQKSLASVAACCSVTPLTFASRTRSCQITALRPKGYEKLVTTEGKLKGLVRTGFEMKVTLAGDSVVVCGI
jgi:hypothetical protein